MGLGVRWADSTGKRTLLGAEAKAQARSHGSMRGKKTQEPRPHLLAVVRGVVRAVEVLAQPRHAVHRDVGHAKPGRYVAVGWRLGRLDGGSEERLGGLGRGGARRRDLLNTRNVER
jgi:hypothetical protein